MTWVVIIKCHFAVLRLIKFDAVTCVEHMSTRLATSSFTQRLNPVWWRSGSLPGPAKVYQPGSRSKVRSKPDNEKLIYG